MTERLSNTALRMLSQITQQDLNDLELLAKIGDSTKTPVLASDFHHAITQLRQGGYITSKFRPVPGSHEQRLYNTIPLLDEPGTK